MHFSSSSRAPGVLAHEDRPPEVSTTSRLAPTSTPRRRSSNDCFGQVSRHVTFATLVLSYRVTSVSVYRVAWFVIVKRNGSQEERGSASVTQHAALVVALDPYRETIHGLLTILMFNL